jgi:hypothetical protein
MRRFVEGADRGQTTLFPECLEDWIGADITVRVIDVSLPIVAQRATLRRSSAAFCDDLLPRARCCG